MCLVHKRQGTDIKWMLKCLLPLGRTVGPLVLVIRVGLSIKITTSPDHGNGPKVWALTQRNFFPLSQDGLSLQPSKATSFSPDYREKTTTKTTSMVTCTTQCLPWARRCPTELHIFANVSLITTHERIPIIIMAFLQMMKPRPREVN